MTGRSVMHRRRVAPMVAVVVAVLGVTACAPPGVGVTSPFSAEATQLVDGHWEANFVACTGGGGPVTVTIGGQWGFDTVNPYQVEIFNGWDADPSNRILAQDITATVREATSPALAPGSCFAVKVRNAASRFASVITWCSEGCTVVPTPPAIAAFGTSAGPFSAPALIPFSWRAVDPNSDPLTCRVDVDSDGSWELTIPDCPRTGARNITVGAGAHIATFEVSDGTHAPVRATTSYSVAVGPTEPYDIVIEPTAPLDPSVSTAVSAAVERWSAVISRGVPDEHVSSPAGNCGVGWPAFDGVVDDVVIRLLVVPLDGRGGVAGTAAPCVEGADGLARLGVIYLDSADVPFLGPRGLDDLVAHEMGHVFGFGSGRWMNLVHDGASDDPRFVGQRAVVEWNRLGGGSAVPVQPGDLAHWRDEVLPSELMAAGLNAPPMPLSAITVAALADFGYHVDITAAEPYSLG